MSVGDAAGLYCVEVAKALSKFKTRPALLSLPKSWVQRNGSCKVRNSCSEGRRKVGRACKRLPLTLRGKRLGFLVYVILVS